MGDKKVIKMKFKDAPIGVRFNFPKSNKIWVKINAIDDGLICTWNGNVQGHQDMACFCDKSENIDLDTQIELIE